MSEQVSQTRSIVFYPAVFIVLVAAIALGRFVFAPECYTIRERVPAEGSQGYQTWYGETLKSFYHRGRRMCIPKGWRAVGAVKTGNVRGGEAIGWATFEDGKTGIMIQNGAFAERTIPLDGSNYAVTLLYPAETPDYLLLEYARITENAFNRIGAVFNDEKTETPVPHTVLVTAGLAGASADGGTFIYPDPRSSVTIFVRDPQDPRSEELVIHAVVHLYNRFGAHDRTYLNLQSPLSSGDFEELEATWAETAFRTSDSGRENRLAYLYNVHTAVETGNFDLITGPPFDDREAFATINPGVAVPQDASELDIQYGHYVLGPLSMLAIDGLLDEAGAPADVEKILTRIHAGEAENLFAELARYLTDEELNTAWQWMDGEETVPRALIQTALERYDE